jgi:hypothetical protein
MGPVGSRRRRPKAGIRIKLSATVFFLLTLSVAALSVRARQGSPGLELREVRGSTVHKNDSPVASAVIYLQEVSTLTVKTYIPDDRGKYHFSGLDPSVDYEIHDSSRQ